MIDCILEKCKKTKREMQNDHTIVATDLWIPEFPGQGNCSR